MAPNLTSGEFRIVSLIEGHPPVGVNHTRPAAQNVHLNGPVRTVWQFFVWIQDAMLTASAVVENQGRRPQHLSTQYRRISLHRDSWGQGHCFHPPWAKCRMVRHLPAPSGRIHVSGTQLLRWFRVPLSRSLFSIEPIVKKEAGKGWTVPHGSGAHSNDVVIRSPLLTLQFSDLCRRLRSNES